VLLCFYTSSSAGSLMPASPQTHELCIALEFYDGDDVTRWQECFCLTTILWDHSHVCSWLLTKMSLHDAWLYVGVLLQELPHAIMKAKMF
jgi:hypothetical protein